MNRYVHIGGDKQINHQPPSTKLKQTQREKTVMMDSCLSHNTKLLFVIFVFISVGRQVSGSDATGLRHVYISAVPFSNMQLQAPVLTSLAHTSVRQCGLRCLEESLCQSFNYDVTKKECHLLKDYLCSFTNDFITRPDFRYYDVEKDTDLLNITEAHRSNLCYSDAICSPKCNCYVIGYSSLLEHYMTPDDPQTATVTTAADEQSCMASCVAKPLTECRAINTRNSGSFQCQHLSFLPSQRPPSRLIQRNGWTFHRRQCF